MGLDTFKGTGDPSANFVGITDGATATGPLHWLATSTAVPGLRTATRHVKVTVASGVMKVSVDGVQYLSQAVTLGPNVLVGFGGSTGGGTDVHSVKNVVITSGATTTAPALSVSPTSVPFGNVTVGSTSSPVSVTISNVGNAPLTVNTVTGPAAPFSAANLPANGGTIAPGGSVLASVTFAPTAAVASTGSIAITTNGGNATVNLSGTGTVATSPVLSVSPTSVPFGTVTVGSSVQSSVTISNVGNAPLTVNTVTGPAAPFSATGLPANGASIAAGASVTATLTFAPTAAVASTGSIAITTNGGNSTVALSGTGTSGSGGVSVPPPAAGVWQLNGSSSLPSAGVLQLTPAVKSQAGTAFYPTAVSSSSLTADFDATINSGTGADGMTFILANPAAGASPTSLGDLVADLAFAPIPGVAVGLDTFKGTGDPSANFVGITDGATATGPLHWLATSTAVPGLRTATRHVKVTVASGVMKVSVDGVQYLSQAVTLGPNVLVGFGGSTGGGTDVHSVKNVVITSGATTTAPALSVSPTSVPFGNVTVGSTSSPVSVTISNVGNAPLTVNTVTGPAAPFSATGLPANGASIAAGASVTATLTFAPTAAVASTGSIAITTNGGNSTVALSGTGTSGSGGVSVPPPAAGVWQLNGSSTLPSAGVLQLTPAVKSQAGTAFYPTAVSSSTLTADFDLTINSGTGADGMTFILANPAAGATPTSLGDFGGDLGFAPIPGIAVAFDTFKGTGDPSANFVGITDGETATGPLHWLATSTAVPGLRTATRHVKVTVASGVMTVSVDGVQYLSQAVTLGPNVLVGFGGSTGGGTDIHSVKNVVITVG